MWKEFKKFILKGNIFDMAVGVIIGGAFGKIVTSLVNDILMPFIGIFVGGIDFTTLRYVISPAVLDETGAVIEEEAAICYGNFIQQTVDFLIIALCIFFMLKAATAVSKKLHAEKETAPEPPKGPTAEELLTEIRDMMRENKGA